MSINRSYLNILSIGLLLLNSSDFAYAQKKLLLIGGATNLCSSLQPTNCDSKIDWQKLAQDQGYPSNVQIKYQEMLQLTDLSIQNLKAKKDYPSWAISDLQRLDKSKKYSVDDFKTQIAKIDSHFIDDLSDDNWEATLNFLSITQSEIVSYKNSPVYTQNLFDKFVDLSGGSNAVIGIVSASSQDYMDTYIFYKNAFKLAGPKEVVWIPIDLALRKARQNNDCDNIQNYVASEYGEYDTKRRYPDLTNYQIQKCKDSRSLMDDLNRITGIFFCGGDQAKHKESFITSSGSDTDEMKIIRQRVNSGQVTLSGSSAGTAVMGGPSKKQDVPMIAGGQSFQSLVDKPLDYICTTSDCQDDLQYDPQGGLDIFQTGLLDTHFSQRGRQGRAIRLASLRNLDFAFGCDETTAILLIDQQNQTTINVIGEYGISLFDLRSSKKGSSSQFSIQNVYWSYLTQGDQIVFSQDGSIKISAASFKSRVRESGRSLTTTDVFSSPDRQSGRDNYMEFVVIGTSLIDSTDTTTWGETYETDPSIYRVNFKKVSSTQGFKGVDPNGDQRYSIINMSLDVQPKSRDEDQTENVARSFLSL
ncbi:cyanophycinase-related exopeptidase-like protein [Stylonychia lemnae]|uniref:Cyanophycinase-related exopeptidase-like protein n=1 Tax=Stylonychia lemnae TaxID=5949 RepID=A0A078A5E5_STYLE|nr:cyanophycinase-related exopeptidase-like protein [Stylonychia lemnae]CDW77114.1 cyanophycinase-related exopeptidase-like protein [Stylonychia lemnae]|eukprot:CDW75645.1 cyanophycinase-related exopeptidase-like protein [Stylonychia lemnae]